MIRSFDISSPFYKPPWAFEQAAPLEIAPDKSPKSVAFPVDAIVTYSITFVLAV